MQAANTSTVTSASPVSMLLAMQSPGGRESAFRPYLSPTAPTKARKRRSASEDAAGRAGDDLAEGMSKALEDLRACAIEKYAKLVDQQPTSMSFDELAAHSRFYELSNPIIKRLRDAHKEDAAYEDFGVPRKLVRNLFGSKEADLFNEEDSALLEYELHVPE